MAYKKKETEVRLISEFDGHKKICVMKKSHSPITLLFCTNDLPDEWLIDVVEYREKTGIISDDYYITSAQLEKWVDYTRRVNGFNHIETYNASKWNLTNF